MRSVGIFNGRCIIADDREAGVFHRHAVAADRPFFSHDCVFESGVFKCLLPVVDTLDEVGAPLLRRCGVDVVDNWFFGLHQFAAFHLLHVGAVLRFQAPTGDEAHRFRALLVVGKDVVCVSEITNAWIEEARNHRVFREEHKGDVEPQGDASRV